MKTNTIKMLRKIFALLMFFGVSIAYSQNQPEGDYCPGPGQIGDEYEDALTNIPTTPGSGTCAIQQVWALIDFDDESFRLAFEIGNSGTALFRLYIDADNDPNTGLLIENNFGGNSQAIAGAEFILQIRSNNGATTLYEANPDQSSYTQIPLGGLTGANGNSNGCNGNNGKFLEFYIPFSDIGYDPCDSNNPGQITIAQYASVNGGSTNSSYCLGATLDFGVQLSGSVQEDQTICSGTNADPLTLTTNGTNSNVVTWEVSTDGGINYTDIPNTAGDMTYTPMNLATGVYYYRAEIQNTDICTTSFFTSAAVITVTDDEAPSITCPTPTNPYDTDADECSASLSFTATATDNCNANPSVVYFIDGNVITFPYDFPVGTTTVTATASDNNNNTSSCSFDVVVEDNQDPTFNETLPGNITVECDNIPEPVVLTALDNCPGASVSYNQTRADGSCANNYQLTRTWTVTDSSNNSVTHTQTITVQDTTAPEFVEALPADTTVECDAVPAAATLTATDNCGDANVTFDEVRTDGSCPSSYSLARTWTATDECGLTTEHTQTIIVQDTTAPEFVEALPADTTVECDAVPAAATLTATDNCGDANVTFDEVRTDGSCPSSYSLARTWTATDECGLTTEHTQTIIVQDTTAPEFVEALPADTTVECDAVPAAATLTATDNCGDANVTFDEVRTDGSCPSSYSLARTWTATDECGLTTEHTQTIIVQDTTAPEFVEALPADTTVECDAVPAAATLTATDNCGDANVTFDEVRTDGSCPSSYSLARTWTATDECGLTTEHTQTIIVQDTTAPEFVEALPADTTVECDAVPAAATLTATDNCGDANVTFDEVRTDGSCPSSYSLARTWTATDECGLTTEHTQTIIVQDTTAPEFVEALPADTTVECDAVPAAATLTATDNCGDANVTFDEVRTDGSCPSSYSLARTWTATDECGLTTEHTQTIIVQDTTAPEFVEALPADTTVECDAVPAAATLTATDNCGDANVTFDEVRTDGSCPSSYSLARTWTATDECGLTTEHTQTIIVQDTTAPEFVEALPADTTVECDAVPAAATLTATDNCGDANVTFDEVRTDGSCPSSYSLARTWTATDECGLTTEHTQTIIVQDTTAPEFVEALPADTTVECDAVPAAATLTATDNCGDANVTFDEVRTDGSCPSSYSLARTWTATDECGLTTEHTQTIIVQDTTAPEFVEALPADTTVECDAVPAAATLTATDNCGDANVTFDEVRTDGSCPSSYSLARTWTATDECGLTTEHTQTIIVQDTTAPEFVEALPADTTVECDAVPAAATLTATDNCGDANVTFDEVRTDGSCPSSYSLARTWTATDECGLTTEHTQTIIVQDTTAPEFVEALPADTTVECDAVPAAATLTATDNCGDANVTFDEVRTDGSCPSSYSLARTWTATDECGLTTEHTQTIIVQDTTAPEFVEALPADTTVECDAVPAAATLTATDNCGDANVTFDEVRTDGSCPSSYSLARTWTATDECGLTTEHTQTIIVQDTTAPEFVEALPADTTVECDAVPAAATLTATDNCGDANVTFDEVRTDGSCPSSYSLARTWTATDECGLTTEHTQTIIVQDTTAPEFVEALPADTTVECDAVPAAATLTATDNCGNANVTFDEVRTDGSCPSSYSLARTWTATDECGLTTEHTQTIIVQDTTAPDINDDNVENIEIECGVTPDGALQNWLDDNAGATASDNCGTVTWSNDYGQDTSVQCDNGPVTVTFTATDECQNTSSVTATYLIQDTADPVITIPADVTIECTEDESSANTGVATGSDDCSAVTITESDSVLEQCGNTRTITRTWTATDACNNSVSGDQIITVVDTTPPTISIVASDQTVECDGSGNTDQLQAWLDSQAGAMASETCGTFEWTNNFTGLSDGCGETGSAIVTFTATDECGNSSSTSAKFEIEDNLAPELVVPDSVTVECDEDTTTANLGEATVTDICDSNANVTFNDVITDGDCAGNYTITRTWTATDACDNTVSADQTITVQDTTAPELTVPASITAECDEDVSTDALGVATATDNCSTNIDIVFNDVITDGNCAGNYTITRTWTATDECNNSVSADQTITVQDTTAPELTVPNSVTIECDEENTTDALGVATAIDNCDANPNVTFNDVIVQGDCAGEYTITRTWTATDECNNSVSVDQVITVQDTTPPTITLPDDVTLECTDSPDPSNTGFAMVTDNCSAGSVDYTDVITQGDCAGEYTITRTWTAMDECGNMATADQTITVQDTTAPQLTVPDSVTAECSDDLSTDALGTATATDNCDSNPVVSFEDTTTEGDCPNSYTITRTWTASDECGNSVSADQVIIVQDTTAPIAPDAPADEAYQCSADVPAPGDLIATDNCEEDITVTGVDSINNDDPCNIIITRTWTFTDSCNNSSSVSQTITVADTTAPTAPAAPADEAYQCIDDVPAAGDLTANDNCEGDITVSGVDTVNDADTCNVIITRTWTFTDSCNNSSSVSQTITVADTTAPAVTDTPADEAYQCIDDVPAPGDLTATDNCEGDITVTGVDSTNNTDPCNVIITRTWTFTDSCNNTNTVTQTITVADTTAPTLADGVTFESNISVQCDEIPPAPSLSFVDNCVPAADLSVNFEENSSQGNGSGNYDVVRTWTVSDGCNQVTFTQVVSVSTANITVTDGDRCWDDGTINLFDFLSGDVDPDGTWSVVVGDVTLNGSQFDPTEDLTDSTLTFLYSVPDGPCANDIEVDVFINDDCVVEPAPPCGREFVDISKTVTPNGDQFNQFFEVTGIEDCGYEVQLQIFNRWGAIIYKDGNYQNNWSGEAPSGSVGNSNCVPTGTYYYIINLRNSGFAPFSGPIYVATK